MYKINRTTAVVSLLAGFIALGLCFWLRLTLEKTLNSVLMTALLFTALYVVSFAAVSLSSFLRGSFNQKSYFASDRARWTGAALAGLLFTFAASLGLEWVYECDLYEKSAEPTSYGFVLDESGSMATSDTDGKRYEAIREIISEKESSFPYMIYTFADEVKLVREMKPISEGHEDFPPVSDGGTSIGGAVARLRSDYESGVWKDQNHPKVIFLTDGYATDLPWGIFGFSEKRTLNGHLKNLGEAGVEISTVGLGSADEGLLRHIAETTGGTFISIEDASQLTESMKQAALSQSGRTLLSERRARRGDWIYALMRIAFLFIIGALSGASMMIAYSSDVSTPLIIVLSIGEALLGGLLMEFGLKAGISQPILWCILWVLISLTVGYIRVENRQKSVLSPSEEMLLHSV